LKKNTVDERFNEGKSALGYTLPWIVGGLVAITSQLAATSVQKLFESYFGAINQPLTDEQFLLYFVYVILFVISLIVFYFTSKSLFKPRTRMREEISPRKRSHLFIIFSIINSYTLEKCGDDLIPTAYNLKLQGLESLSDDLKEMEEKKINWSWQMVLKAIAHHVGDPNEPTLEKVILICSPESLEQLPQFLDIFSQYVKNTDIELQILGKKDHQACLINSDNIKEIQGVCFEDFNDLSDTISRGIKLLKQAKIREKDMIIDVTGGQKVASIVAAALTFNTKIKAQYVSTVNYAIKAYDVIYGTNKIQ